NGCFGVLKILERQSLVKFHIPLQVKKLQLQILLHGVIFNRLLLPTVQVCLAASVLYLLTTILFVLLILIKLTILSLWTVSKRFIVSLTPTPSCRHQDEACILFVKPQFQWEGVG